MKKARINQRVLVDATVVEVIETAKGIKYKLEVDDLQFNSFYAYDKNVITCNYCTDNSNMINICDDCAEKINRSINGPVEANFDR